MPSHLRHATENPHALMLTVSLNRRMTLIYTLTSQPTIAITCTPYFKLTRMSLLVDPVENIVPLSTYKNLSPNITCSRRTEV
jgi:hypothetical protein